MDELGVAVGGQTSKRRAKGRRSSAWRTRGRERSRSRCRYGAEKRCRGVNWCCWELSQSDVGLQLDWVGQIFDAATTGIHAWRRKTAAADQEAANANSTSNRQVPIVNATLWLIRTMLRFHWPLSTLVHRRLSDTTTALSPSLPWCCRCRPCLRPF